MSDENGLDSQSYNKNYKVLKETADWLSKQDEPDIDQLVPRVEKAMKAYQICRDRLSKVQATLGQYFQEGGAVGEQAPSADGDGQKRKVTRPAPDADGEDDNIPF
jgi:exodeoxyribonuclease VII small subunit